MLVVTGLAAGRCSKALARRRSPWTDLGSRGVPVGRPHRGRSCSEVVDRQPSPDAEHRGTWHVVFLDGAPSAAGRKAFDAELARHPERGLVVGTEAYVDYVNGAGRSKLDWDRVARADGVTGTARNWRTRPDPAREGLSPPGSRCWW